MSALFASLSVPPFLSDGLTSAVSAALKPDAAVPPFVELPPPDVPPLLHAASARTRATVPATTAPVLDLTVFPPYLTRPARRDRMVVLRWKVAALVAGGWSGSPGCLRVERVTQAVAEQVEREHGNEDRHA